MLDAYNTLVAEGRGSDFDREGMAFIQSRPPFQLYFDDEVFDMGPGYFQRPEIALTGQYGVVRRAAVSFSSNPAIFSGAVFMYGDDVRHAFNNTTKSVVQQISPHMAKSLEVFRFTRELRSRYNAVLSVLDRIGTGIVVASERGEIILENKAATRLFDVGDRITRDRKNQISCRNTDIQDRLRDAIARVARTAVGDNDDAGTMLGIDTNAMSSPLVAVVSPLRDAHMEIEKGLTGAFVTLIDPDRQARVQTDVVALAFGLTRAETVVAGHVMAGRGNKDIADRLNVSPETVKSQVSAVLQKCGCANRVNFLWRVFQMVPPIE